jgi:DNA-binding SARP family transcriptional activator
MLDRVERRLFGRDPATTPTTRAAVVRSSLVEAYLPSALPDAVDGGVFHVEQRHVLAARLLGPFEFSLDGVEVVNFDGRLGVSVLKYLLSSPKHGCPRDQLLEMFWPGADPTRARNRLHAAITALRRSVRHVSVVKVIEFHDGMYRIPPSLDLDIDVDEFERLTERGRSAEIAHDAEKAIDAFRRSAASYRGDFLPDMLYDDWTLLPREHFRVRYLDNLDRLAQLLARRGQHAECIETAQLILGQDRCREDAFRLIMQSNARMGHKGEVARQYELCRRSLHDGLGVSPDPSTIALYRRLKGA